MLENIKSIYFIKIIFSFVDETTKLKLIKYNKNLQNKISINLINYKLFTGKYIIYKTKTEAQEFFGNNDTLAFEGEYLNGERNGKGIEYINFFDMKNVEFEGEYLKGKRHGKGKEYYYSSGRLKFEGEYKNGKRWNGILYEPGGKQYKLKEGKGFIKDCDQEDGSIFEGEYVNGEKNGKGKEYYQYYNFNEIIFEGEYLNGKRWNGKKNKNEPNNRNYFDLKEGKGVILECKFFLFLNQYLNGKKNGIGKTYSMNNLIFEGEYLNGKKNGKGIEYDLDGTIIFEGEYLYDFERKGKKYINGKLEYEGEYLYNKKWSGKGYDENGNVIYELINGNGKIKEYSRTENELEYEGEYLNGKRNGKGKEYKKGKIIFEGEYLNGKRVEH